MQNHWSDDDTVKKMRLDVSKMTSEQRHDMLCEYWSRYWRFTVLETYGNRSAINHLRLIL